MLPLALVILMQTGSPLAVVDDLIRGEQDIVDYEITLSIPEAGSVVHASTQIRYLVGGGSGPLVLDFDDALVVDSVRTADATGGSLAVRWDWNRELVGERDQR